jgi:AcrR family transcriptional regulator
MDRSQSKYFSTAARMDEALLHLLEKKDLEYITVKEICAAAGVNRSTFYLHYETVGDLLAESTKFMIDRFLTYIQERPEEFISSIQDRPLEELFLVTPQYLTPYLQYIKDNRRLFRISIENAGKLGMTDSFLSLFRHVFVPILTRYQVPEADMKYFVMFNINGLMAIVMEWLKRDCEDPVEHVVEVMRRCVRQPGDEKG